MNILVQIWKDFKGCGFYRLYQPHVYMAKNKQAKITFNTAFKKEDGTIYSDEELKEFDMIVWHKDMGADLINDVRRAKSLGIPTIADFDDHWVLNDKHTLVANYKKNGTTVKYHKLILTADYVTCTTELLAEAIRQHNKNVIVIQNAVDPEGVKNERVKDEKYCFGYLGGHYHIRDVGLLEGLQAELTANCKDYELILFGFDNTPIYQRYAEILSNNRQSENFKLYKGLPIFQYYHFYNLMDCSLVPLEANKFNIFKSELKLIEAGFFKKAVIVSNVQPYTNIITKKNCLKVDNKADWYNHCKKLIENPNLSKDLGESLFQSVQRYSLENVNKTRHEFYSNVHKKHNHNRSAGVSRLETISG